MEGHASKNAETLRRERRARPRVVYVIGGIGSGKSSVVQCLERHGVPTYDLDEAGHEALRRTATKRALRAAFGDGVFDETGEVVRSELARIAFSAPEHTAQLNRITTKAIVDLMDAWLERRADEGYEMCAVEVSAYDGPGGRFPDPDEIIAVVAPLETRVARAVSKGFPEDDVRARIARQAHDDDRRAWADVVFENDGSFDDLREAVEKWLLQVSPA